MIQYIEYKMPESWEDKGMDWRNPDPRCADYVMAIRQAILERCAALHTGVPAGIVSITPYQPVVKHVVDNFVWAIREMASRFVNTKFSDYKSDYSDFPKMWSYRDIIDEKGCQMFEYAKAGDLCENGGAWLSKIRKAIDLLTVIRCPGGHSTQFVRNGSCHDPPFSESIGTAMEQAMDDERGLVVSDAGVLPQSISAWSGNTHWKCPRPKEEGEEDSEEDDENNKHGYCGYASLSTYRINRVSNWLAGSAFDILAYVYATPPTGAVQYAQELTTSIFDGGGSGLRKGMTVLRKTVTNPDEVDLFVGDPDSIPKNSTVPQSDFDEDGNATYRRSAKRGYEAKVWTFMDYGRANGFKFR